MTPSDKKRVTVDQHAAFQQSLCKPSRVDELWDEHLAADPIHDRVPEVREHGKIRRVLELLDSLDQEGGNY